MLRIAYLLLSTALVTASTGFSSEVGPTSPTVGPSSSVAPSSGREIVRVAKARDGLFYLTLAVNGYPVRFLVDTGATVVMLREADALGAGIVGDRDGAMLTAGGSRRIRWGSAEHMTLTGTDYGSIDVAITDPGLGTSLLGQNLLSRLGTVTIQDETMIVSEPGERG